MVFVKFVLFVLSESYFHVFSDRAGVLLFIAVKFGSMKNRGGRNKASYFESENRKARYNSGRNDGKFY